MSVSIRISSRLIARARLRGSRCCWNGSGAGWGRWTSRDRSAGVTLETIAAIWQLAEHVAGTDDEDLPESAAAATRMFLLDTLVGGRGKRGALDATPDRDSASLVSRRPGAVWSHGAPLRGRGPVCNAYQTHNGEFDCVHEDAVVHTFTVPVAAALAWARGTRLPDQPRSRGRRRMQSRGRVEKPLSVRGAARRDHPRRRPGSRSLHPSSTRLSGSHSLGGRILPSSRATLQPGDASFVIGRSSRPFIRRSQSDCRSRRAWGPRRFRDRRAPRFDHP